MKQVLQDLLVTAFGAVASLLTAIILFVVEDQFGFAFYSFMLWFVVPVGAILSGFVPAGGYYVGARIFEQKPSNLILFNMVAVSIGTFFLIHYLSYITLEIDGQFISDHLPFSSYMDSIVQNQSYGLVRVPSLKTGKLGTWGYAIATFQIIGFAIGGAAVFAYLSSLPYCEQCFRFLKKVGQRDRFASAAEPFVARLGDFSSLIAEQKFNDAIQFHAKKMGVGTSFSSGHHLRTRIITRICSNCGINHLKIFGSKLDGDSWTDIPESEIGIFTHEKLTKVESD